MLLKKLSLETFVKKYPETLSPKTTVRKCCLNHYHSKRSSQLSLAECCRKKYIESVAKNNRTEVLLKKPPLETFATKIRSRMPPKKYGDNVSLKTTVSKCWKAVQKTAAQNIRQKYYYQKAAWKFITKKCR